MDCARYHEAIHGYIDGDLSDHEVVGFRHHLAFCPDCAAALTELSAVRSALGAARHVELQVPGGFAERVLTAVGDAPVESLEDRITGLLSRLRVPRRFDAPVRAAIYSGLAVVGYLAFRAQQQHARRAREVKA
jgi:anti-sigma factor RsiW